MSCLFFMYICVVFVFVCVCTHTHTQVHMCMQRPIVLFDLFLPYSLMQGLSIETKAHQYGIVCVATYLQQSPVSALQLFGL